MIFVFWMLSFKPTFSLSSFTFITQGDGDGQGGLACCNSWGRKELDTTERLSWTELKQGDNIQPWCILFPIWKRTVYCSMSSSNCCFLTCLQISQEAGKAVWYSHLFQNFPEFVVIHTVEDFSIINEAEVFLEFPHFFLWSNGYWQLGLSLVPLPFLNPAWTSRSHSSCTVEAWLGEFWALLY